MKTESGHPSSSDKDAARPGKETGAGFVAPQLIIFTLVGAGCGLAVSIIGGLLLESWVHWSRPAGPQLS